MTPTDNGGRPLIERRLPTAVRQLGPPPLTVWLGSAMYTFPAGRDATVGRDRTSDIWLRDTDPATFTLISRVHAILRFDGTNWVLIDKSQNGVYVDGIRRSIIPVTDAVKVALGSPQGPQLTFRVPSANTVESLHNLTTRPPVPPVGPINDHETQPFAGPISSPGLPVRPPVRRESSPPPLSRRFPSRPPRPGHPDLAARVGDTMRLLVSPPRAGAAASGTKTVGRSKSNDIVVDDYLVSRVHALLVSTVGGLEIRDNNSSNGTFVNGSSVTRSVLQEGDVVTVGNTDLMVSGTSLVPRTAPARTSGLAAHGLGLTIDGHQLLTDVSFTARPGTLTAVIGPSGAGKSTLIKLIGGATKPSGGVVSFDGHDIHAEYASMRSRIGMVPQDDVVHRQLTLEHALNYAAELRLPPDTSADDRREVVERVLDELELTKHKKTRVDKLSGGQRKRASVAMELLTGPSLLILDEPTSGLDPALDRQVMTMLRRLADAGRVVLVVTHSLTYVNMCDQVLLLAPGGKTAFADPPGDIGSVMGTNDWADIFAKVSTDADAVHQAFLARQPPRRLPPASTQAAPLGKPPQTSLWRQVFTLVRRQARLITADRGYFAFLAALPFVLGVLSLAVPGNTGLGFANPQGPQPEEPIDIMILLNIGVVFMGTALTVRDLVGERLIFQREQAVGLSGSAYLVSKTIVYSIAALIQTAILTAIMVVGKGAPQHGGVVLGKSTTAGITELYLTLAITAIVSALVGLALSSLARSTEQVLPMLVVAIMVAMVLAGGLIPVTGRLVLDQLSWLLPARWGFAAAASTIDLRNIEAGLPADKFWQHTAHSWLLDVGMLVVLGLVFTALVRFRLRLPVHSHGR
ncbi:MAG: ATP-binding cassette domain-containing protein [Mycobacterium sp.]|uniref:ATP-binding cassette domain-containing protein n=1 Tax=Mycobacterium sp. TaxID=1785 RepID=UPI003CC6A745